jgi:hypothetical protein
VRTADAEKHAIQRLATAYLGIDSSSEGDNVRINCASNDAAMLWPIPVQTDKMATVMGQQCPMLCDGKGKDVLVRNALSGPTAFRSRQYVVAQPPKLIHNREWEVLVSIDASHSLGPFVLGYLAVDFVTMGLLVGPGVDEVFCMKRGIALKDVCFAHPEAPRLHENPDGNAGADDARLAAADTRITLNTGREHPNISRE